ncbi:MAG: L-aspartate oxidase [Gammaproteobacteria bacterium]|nr:L-aspartate oxidase [Gammaproteobacteria bacterium]
MSRANYDVLIIGAGLGGTALALRLADAGHRVGLLSKKDPRDSSSNWAQGGIAAAIGPDDTPQLHAHDTNIAGAGLCNQETVELVTERGPDCIAWLQDRGVRFTQEADGADAGLHLAREGAHSQRRVVHAADATGRAVMAALLPLVQAHQNIEVLDDLLAIDLITTRKLDPTLENRCIGAYALDRQSGHVRTLQAQIVVLATGGASKVYLYTTNPDTSTGDGIAMAWRAGCRVANLEFVQFHPTCLYHPLAKSVLISEALRGEGGRLLLPNGERFMPTHDERGELAPRDIVARAIDYEMKRGGHDCVYLDISHLPSGEIRAHFPNITRRCAEFGIDITAQPIPVVPAAHYTCGGVVTDLNAATDIPGLFAIGECTFTGLHGANRLASNSLLECVVFADQAGQQIHADLPRLAGPGIAVPDWDESRVTDPDEQVVVSHNWDELRRFMWDYVGIVRTNKRLERARHRVELLQEEIAEFYGNFRVTNDLIELRNLALVAELTIRSAKARHESRGLHFNRDYPNSFPNEEADDTVLSPTLGREGLAA